MWLVSWKEAIILIKTEKTPPWHLQSHTPLRLLDPFDSSISYLSISPSFCPLLLRPSPSVCRIISLYYLPLLYLLVFISVLFSLFNLFNSFFFPSHHRRLSSILTPRAFHPSFSSFNIVLSIHTFLLRVVRTWKGWICFFSRSQATASESRTQDTTESFFTFWRK